MADLWSMGPTAAALVLRAQGFTPQQADTFVELRRRYERGEFREVTIEQKRKRFARWLVEHGRLTEFFETVETAELGEPSQTVAPEPGSVQRSPAAGERVANVLLGDGAEGTQDAETEERKAA